MRKKNRSFSLPLFFTTLAAALALVGLWPVQAPVSAHAGMVRSSARARGGDPAFPAIHASSAVLPVDLPAPASSTTLAQAATFAWQEFIALNWPADTGTATDPIRDTADTSKMFGDQSVPLVWQTFRGKVEIYPGNGDDTHPPHGGQDYDDPPQYVYSSAPVIKGTDVPACSGQSAPTQPAWINLDEVSQIASDSMYAGVVHNPRTTQPNSKPNLFRYMAKANRTEYLYVLQNEFWYASPSLQAAQNNFVRYVVNRRRVPPKSSPYVFFPASSASDPGTIEVKAAWRPLDQSEDPSRYHQTTVRYYEIENQKPCYREDRWALISLHIIRKTPFAPSFIYATFEQADNILDSGGNAIENVDGSVKNPPAPSPATNPPLTYRDRPKNPSLLPAKANCSPGKQLYYQNIRSYINSKGVRVNTNTGLPQGTICVDYRYNAIPSDVVAVNSAAQAAIQQYNSSAPWQYYKLVNVQWQPFGNSKINRSDPNHPYNPATYHQANIAVETNYTLQMFSGRFAKNGAVTDYNDNGHRAYQNVFTLDGSGVHSVDMGGCMGCHGAGAQRFGADFSFILGSSVTAPETPDEYYSLPAIVKKYQALFQRR